MSFHFKGSLLAKLPANKGAVILRLLKKGGVKLFYDKNNNAVHIKTAEGKRELEKLLSS